MQYLVLLTGTEKGKAVRLNKAITVGRHKSCDLVIRLKQISRRHCKLSPTADGGWVVTDLGTSNGTRVNDEKVIERRLEDGDEVGISTVRIRFRDEVKRQAAQPAPQPAAEGEEIEPTIAMHDDGEAPELTAAVDMAELMGQPKQKPATASGGAPAGIRFGLGLAAGVDPAAAEDEVEGTAFMDMESVLEADEEVEGTQFVDMKDLMLAEPGAGTGLLGAGSAQVALFAVIGVLGAVLIGLVVWKQVINPGKERVRLPDQVVERSQRLDYPYPQFDSFKIEDETIVTGIAGKDRTSITLVGVNPGNTLIRLIAPDAVYTAQIRVVVPKQEELCRRIREKYKGQSISSVKGYAAEFYRRGLSNYEQRNEHLKNLYESTREISKAWCLLAQLSEKPSLYFDTKKLLDKAEDELKQKYDHSRTRVQRFIKLSDWWRLKKELKIMLELIPDPGDWRHQRSLAIQDHFKRKLQKAKPPQ